MKGPDEWTPCEHDSDKHELVADLGEVCCFRCPVCGHSYSVDYGW